MGAGFTVSLEWVAGCKQMGLEPRSGRAKICLEAFWEGSSSNGIGIWCVR